MAGAKAPPNLREALQTEATTAVRAIIGVLKDQITKASDAEAFAGLYSELRGWLYAVGEPIAELEKLIATPGTLAYGRRIPSPFNAIDFRTLSEGGPPQEVELQVYISEVVLGSSADTHDEVTRTMEVLARAFCGHKIVVFTQYFQHGISMYEYYIIRRDKCPEGMSMEHEIVEL